MVRGVYKNRDFIRGKLFESGSIISRQSVSVVNYCFYILNGAWNAKIERCFYSDDKNPIGKVESTPDQSRFSGE